MVYIALIWVVAGSGRLSAQTDFYDLGSIREIRIYFEEANWDHILDSLYVDGEEERLEGVVEIDGTRLEGVGIRYKGFSSVSVNRRKNPFNIKLDYTDPDQHYQQINKLKLSNVIQDPSFVREVLSYEIGRKYMPASRANFANVYINDTLWGLYTNVEAVNKDFLDLHYDSRRNAFFKCNPEALDLNGENANLSNSPGTDVAQYHPLYELKSDDGWDRLYHLIDTLNNVPDSLHRVLNVDQTLWMHAFNYALINFDSYVVVAPNAEESLQFGTSDFTWSMWFRTQTPCFDATGTVSVNRVFMGIEDAA
ncbi:MAG: CotH kinase family protein, partial [Bacteroidota bacterium]